MLLFALQVRAQDRSITGKITSSDDGSPLPGVNVIVKGTTNGTVSDATGSYKLSVPANGGTLVFSFIGLQTQEVEIGDRAVVDVGMLTDTKQLSEVVVTAIGLRQDKDKFASSVTTVQGNNVVRSGETGALQGLTGKAAGVLITRNGGDPGAGAYIQIRGQNTINGNAQPLFIIDGIPVNNSSDNYGTNAGNGIVQQSRINDINPEDIASMEVLKGAAAAALWGTRAANGVVIITTKKGRDTGGKVNIAFKSTVSFDKVNKLHKLQTTYGQGTHGRFIQGNKFAFGDRIADRQGGEDLYATAPGQFSTAGGDDIYNGYVTFPDGSVRYVIPAGGNIDESTGKALDVHGGKRSKDVYDHTKDVFRTGHFVDNNITLSGGNAKSTFLVSYSNLSQQGIVKKFSDYKRNNARINASTQFTEWLRASASLAYTNSNSSRIQEGDNVDGILLGGFRTPPDFNNNYYTGVYTDPSGAVYNNAHVSYRNPLGVDGNTIYSNPIWNINNNKNTTTVDRIIGNIELGIDPLSWLNITGRVGVDNFTDARLERFARNSATNPNGFLSKYWITEKQFNVDGFARANKTFNNNFSGSLLVGINYNSRRKAVLSDELSALIVPTAPDILSNGLNSNITAWNYNQLIRTYAYYSQADVQLYDMLFLTLTGRMESASTFGSKVKSSFFFPSAALAWQFTKLGNLAHSKTLSFGKLRVSWGQVGIQPQPYQNSTVFSPANYGESYANGLASSSSLYGGGYVRSTTAGNEFLKPERKTETEVGVDLRFFHDKVNFSATAYDNTTSDVILSITVPSETGFSTTNRNAAKLSNKGLELEGGADIVTIGSFNWNLSANFSMNRNKVVSLAGVEAYILPDSYQQNASLVEGKPFGVFYSTDFKKDDKGKYVLDDNGFPIAGTTNEIIGNPNPKWRGGLGSTFSFKGLSLYVLFDKVYGNDFYNGTRGALYNFGVHADQGVTTVAPAGGLKAWDGSVIPEGTKFQGYIKDFGAGPVAIDQAWWQGPGTAFNGPYKQFIENGGATRLREVTLSYSLSGAGFKQATKLSSIDFSLTGRNLVLWTKYTGTDPEVNITGAGLSRGQDWFTNPNTKSILFSIKITY
jgi:TonB-linked SusC/RagA family outer membrane protein